MKIDLNDDHASVIIEDSKEPIDSSDDDISFKDDHEVDIKYKNLTPYSPQRSSSMPSPKASKISRYSSSRRTPSPDSSNSSTTHPAPPRSGMMTPVKLEYPTIEKEDPPEPNMKNQEKPQPLTSEAMIIHPDRGLERIDYKKMHMKGLDTQEKTEQAKFAKSEEYTQPSIKPTPQSQKKRWNDAMKTDFETLMNENTYLPTLIK